MISPWKVRSRSYVGMKITADKRSSLFFLSLIFTSFSFRKGYQLDGTSESVPIYICNHCIYPTCDVRAWWTGRRRRNGRCWESNWLRLGDGYGGLYVCYGVGLIGGKLACFRLEEDLHSWMRDMRGGKGGISDGCEWCACDQCGDGLGWFLAYVFPCWQWPRGWVAV